MLLIKNDIKYLYCSIILLLLLHSCTKLEPSAPAADSVMDAPIDGLTEDQIRLFNRGAEVFDKVYSSATGLGPIYVSTSCGSCHTGDNRGSMFTKLIRFGQTDTTGNPYVLQGAPQIQNHAIVGHKGEVLPAGVAFSEFIAPIASGSGLLELVSDEDILTMADTTHSDGVSGRPNWNALPDYVTPMSGALHLNGKFICRFGRKGSTYNLLQQTVTAFNQDMGITSTFIPQNPINYAEGLNSTPTTDPEVTDEEVNALVFYIQALQAPLQRESTISNVIHGQSIFKAIGCENCHRETLVTRASPIEALSLKAFHPYTDLLLHDMGPLLDDGYTEGTAMTYEWRTTPLWGLGLAANAQGGKWFLMHDGRAHSIEEAILLHGGEAQKSRNRYEALSNSDRNDLIRFLHSL